MSVRISGSGEYLRRTTDLPDTGAFTITGWCQIVSDRAGSHRYFAGLENNVASSTAWRLIGWTDVDNFIVAGHSSGGNMFSSFPPVDGTWFFFAFNSNNGYWINLVGDVVAETGTGTDAMTEAMLILGNTSFDEWTDCRIGAVKVWDADLSQAEIEAERLFAAPQRLTNLHAVWYLRTHTELEDFSGNARTLTAGGTLSTEADPPITYPSTAPPGGFYLRQGFQ